MLKSIPTHAKIKMNKKPSVNNKTVAVGSTPTIKNFFKNVPSNSKVSVEQGMPDSRAVYVEALKSRLKSKTFSLIFSTYFRGNINSYYFANIRNLD